MHVRLSEVIGAAVVDDHSHSVVATLDLPLIEPDTGRILGFFVHGRFLGSSAERFLVSHDILSWGTSIHVRSSEVLSPPEDLIRLQSKFADQRRFLGQSISIEGSGKVLGSCADVQFDTRHLVIEWIFPKKFLWYRQPIPSSDILEVTQKAIIVRHPLRIVREKVPREDNSTLERGISDILPVQTSNRS